MEKKPLQFLNSTKMIFRVFICFLLQKHNLKYAARALVRLNAREKSVVIVMPAPKTNVAYI